MDHELPDGLGRLLGILAVDVHRSNRHNDIQLKKIVQLLHPLLRDAAERANLQRLLQDNDFHAFRGDGYFIGFHPDLVAPVVDRYIDALQAELRRRGPELRADAIELRLRVSLHLAPVSSFDAFVTDSPSGTSMVEAKRMVDAEPVRALLDHSDPKVTLVAAVLSEDVMKHVVAAGQTARQPSEFVVAPLRVEAKEYSGTGYLRVPVPSGDLLQSGLLHGQPEQSAEQGVEPPPGPIDPGTNSFGAGHADNVTQAGTVQGGVHNDSVSAAYGGLAVRGDGNVTAGRDVDQSTHKQEFSGRFHTQGDSNFGPSSGRRVGVDHDASGR